MFCQLGVRSELPPRRGPWFPPDGPHRPRNSQHVRHPESITASLLLTTEGSSVLEGGLCGQPSANSVQEMHCPCNLSSPPGVSRDAAHLRTIRFIASPLHLDRWVIC